MEKSAESRYDTISVRDLLTSLVLNLNTPNKFLRELMDRWKFTQHLWLILLHKGLKMR